MNKRLNELQVDPIIIS